ncbi:MAG: hypothetical protein JXR89_05935 [Deltaproteobacteria bacterium]|nr:hypothetical protein [Deltaproteobacteria bacterium]
MFLFRREQREHNLLRQRMHTVNNLLTKLYAGPRIAAVAREFGLLGRDGKLRLEKDGDIKAVVDLLIHREKIDGRHPVAVLLEQQKEEFLPALQRQMLESYLGENRFSLYQSRARREKRYLDLEPLLPGQEGIVLDDAMLARVADDDWILAGRFLPWEGHWIHADLIYAFDGSAREKIFTALEEIEPEGGRLWLNTPARFPHIFYRLYREFGIPLGNR